MCGSSTSWYESRSPVTTITSVPAIAARVASVAMTSSASTPSATSTGIFTVSSTSRIRGSWWMNSSGVALRPALYSASIASRKVGVFESNTTAISSGFSSARTFVSIDVNP